MESESPGAPEAPVTPSEPPENEPRGNPPPDSGEVEEGEEKLDEVVGN